MKSKKIDMVRVIVTALYNRKKLVTEKDVIAWRKVLQLMRQKREILIYLYQTAEKVLAQREDSK